jgi:hypothetical protein
MRRFDRGVCEGTPYTNAPDAHGAARAPRARLAMTPNRTHARLLVPLWYAARVAQAYSKRDPVGSIAL